MTQAYLRAVWPILDRDDLTVADLKAEALADLRNSTALAGLALVGKPDLTISRDRAHMVAVVPVRRRA